MRIIEAAVTASDVDGMQFGDQSGAARLRELAAMVEGPRVGHAARFAEALQAGDGAELAAVSEEFEPMGDLVAAVDAAAHRPSRIAAGVCADPVWAALREQGRWPNNAGAPLPQR